MNKYLILFIINLLLVACGHKTETKPSKTAINVEMLGTWGSDSLCKATFTKVNDNLVLARFSDGKNNILSNIVLISKKESIMTTFKAQNAQVDFSGSFLEGVILINTRCSQPLHKVDKY